MQLIDSHTHLIRGLQTWEDLFEAAEAIYTPDQVVSFCVAALPQWAPDQAMQNMLCLLLKLRLPNKAYAFGGLYYDLALDKNGYNFLQQAILMSKMGFDGVKIIEGKPSIRARIGNIPLDSQLYDEFFAYLEQESIPILMHLADPDENWDPALCPAYAFEAGWYYGSQQFPTKETLYQELEHVLTKFPRLRIQLAHFAYLSGDMARASSLLDRHPLITLDITPGMGMYRNFSKQPSAWFEFFCKYQDRIVFGTDNGWGDDLSLSEKIEHSRDNVSIIRKFLETDDSFSAWDMDLKGICLPEDVLRKIYATNFLSFVRPSPARVNLDLARQVFQDEKNNLGSIIHEPTLREDIRFVESSLTKLSNE